MRSDGYLQLNWKKELFEKKVTLWVCPQKETRFKINVKYQAHFRRRNVGATTGATETEKEREREKVRARWKVIGKFSSRNCTTAAEPSARAKTVLQRGEGASSALGWDFYLQRRWMIPPQGRQSAVDRASMTTCPGLITRYDISRGDKRTGRVSVAPRVKVIKVITFNAVIIAIFFPYQPKIKFGLWFYSFYYCNLTRFWYSCLLQHHFFLFFFVVNFVKQFSLFWKMKFKCLFLRWWV